jgi:hypothetical protein
MRLTLGSLNARNTQRRDANDVIIRVLISTPCNVMQSLISIDLGNKCNHSKQQNDVQINIKINLYA